MEPRNVFWTRERECERLFEEAGPFFLVTTENLPWLLYTSDQEFKDGTNIVAVAMAGLPLTVLNEVQMNNHMHLVMEGQLSYVQDFTSRLRKLMHRYQSQKGNPSLLNWEIQIKPIPDLDALRNAILYVSRNPSVAMRIVMPTGYRWSGCYLMFNELLSLFRPGKPFSELTYKQKREICRSRDLELPPHYRVLDGMITRDSFIDYKRAESFFNSAHSYFLLLSRKVEVDVEIARWVGERILLPNEDVFRIVAGWYSVKTVNSLNANQRLEAARRMKAELMSNNKQISQVLRIAPDQVDAMFPTPS